MRMVKKSPRDPSPAMKTTREQFLPGPEAPHWLPSGEPPGGLLYLAWGHRRYGKHPIPQRLHNGWTYMVVLSGRPVLTVGMRRHPIEKGGLIIAGPDVAYGWIDRASASCSVLVWEWSRPPEFRLPVRGHSCWLGKCHPTAMDDIEQLHLRTRGEIERADSRSARVLEALQLLVDAAFERASGSAGDHAVRDVQRLHLAEAWMRRHLDIRAPSRALADYLGISPMTLHRLFREAAGLSTGRAFLDLKMKESARMLELPGISVKAVALTLGYHHPGDFTRAFKKHFGFFPSQSLTREDSRKGS